MNYEDLGLGFVFGALFILGVLLFPVVSNPNYLRDKYDEQCKLNGLSSVEDFRQYGGAGTVINYYCFDEQDNVFGFKKGKLINMDFNRGVLNEKIIKD